MLFLTPSIVTLIIPVAYFLYIKDQHILENTKKINLPLKQIDKKENFRRIIDLKNNSGWIHTSQLKKNTSVKIVAQK